MKTRREFLEEAAAVAGFLGFPQAFSAVARSQPRFDGPLRVCERNPRYFSDRRGEAIYLCGSHVWNNLVDMGPSDPPEPFDFEAYLDFLERYGHNFIRLWTWEHFEWDTRANGRWGKDRPHRVAPHPWPRTGPGVALDGKPRFDLSKFNEDYFQRLRKRVVAAHARGIYVSVMLFEGWAMQRMPDAWRSHPFNPANNINGVDGDANGDGLGLEVHTLAKEEITRIQEAYVRKVVETVGDLDNVLYEISNEAGPFSTEWQYHLIYFLKRIESERLKQHPVGMTFQYRGGTNRALFDSPADWISPNPEGGYRDNPPPGDGRKVILLDTDHLWGIGGNGPWVCKAFTRGHNPLFMDPYDGTVLGKRFDPQWEPIRRRLGVTRRLASRLPLTEMEPRPSLASTGFCLAAPGRAYIVYVPSAGPVTVDLGHATTPLKARWVNPDTGEATPADTLSPGENTLRHKTGDVFLVAVA